MHISEFIFNVSLLSFVLFVQLSFGTTVQTSNGAIVGHVTPKTPRVIEYLGIPYAKAPLGDLRFAAPEKFEGDPQSTFEASRFVSRLGESMYGAIDLTRLL